MRTFLIILSLTLGVLLVSTNYKLAQTKKNVSDISPVLNLIPEADTSLNSDVVSITPNVYKNCEIYSRSNINIPPYDKSFVDKSEVVCDLNGNNIALFDVIDKVNFEDAKNSIYQFWKDTDGYKALIVDQNGAGSGEGNGKIILLQENGYKLVSCFYYTSEAFNPNGGEPQTTTLSPTKQELDYIKKNAIVTTSPYCSNFTLNSYLQ